MRQSVQDVGFDRDASPALVPYRYRHHGLRLASGIALPELDCRRLPEEAGFDVSIARGELSGYAGLNDRATLCAVNGAALFSYTNLGRFLVSGGRDVIADLISDADPALVRSCLLTTVMTMLCHQRGLIVLHASAVAFGDHVLAFAGDSGAGKSTLAAHCLQAGARLVADDILVASFADDGSVLAHPGTSFLKLKTYALESLGRTSDGLAQERPDEDKFLVPGERNLATESLPLRRIHMLEEGAAAGPGSCVKVTGAAALAALVGNGFGVRHLDVIGRRHAHFSHCCRLAQKVEVVRLCRRRDPTQLAATAEMVRDMASQPVPAT